MRIALGSPSKKRALLLGVFLLAAAYILIATLQFVSNWFADRPKVGSVRAATRLDPGNADYHHRLGRLYDLVERNPTAAIEQYQAAVRLNPHDARYWLDLADAYQLSGDANGQARAIEAAVQADPTTPNVAWEAANLYLVEGQTDKALREFRVVMLGDPSLFPSSLRLCWRLMPDVDVLLLDVIPARTDAYLDFLAYLMSKEQTEGTTKVWNALVQLRQPLETGYLFSYTRYLLAHKAVDEAVVVWRQAASLLGLSAYLSSSNNLIVNGSFNLDVLNGGFDWQYGKLPSVTLTLDTSETHEGHRSLSIVFDGPGVSDAGIVQPIVVQPNTTYRFTGYYKNAEMDGAGGPHMALQDLYTSTSYFLSEELRDALTWKSVVGEFTTGPDTRVLVFRIQRLPAGSPIRGKLWIDDLRLVEVTEAAP
jgi:hypothetical protein